MSRSSRRLAVWLLAASAVACAQETRFVQVRESPPDPLSIERLAIAPFRTIDRPGAAPLPVDAAPLVASFVAEAFQARGLDVVAASDVAQNLGFTAPYRDALDAPRVAAEAHRKFGVDALVVGAVYRFRDRSGESMGSTQAASVGFDVRIVSAPDGALLWSGAFDETQVAFSANLLRAPRYPGGGLRWLTVEEFARWGASQVAQTVPLVAP